MFEFLYIMYLWYVNSNEIKDLGEKYNKLETRLKETEENANKDMKQVRQENEQLRSEITNIEKQNTSVSQITSEKK